MLNKTDVNTPTATDCATEIFDRSETAVVYPFVLEKVRVPEVGGPETIISWRPGVRYQMRNVSGESEGYSEAIADGIGAQILTEVSRHKPERFPERVFYTRQWIAPDGRRFGKGGLHIATAEKFRRLTRGYAVPYRIYDEAKGDDAPASLDSHH